MWMTVAYNSVMEMDWNELSSEGQLAVDVFREGNALVIRSTIAGVTPEQIDLAIHGDLLTIRGRREAQREVDEDQWFYKECYWGAFSRSIILPVDVQVDQATAAVKNGVLEIRLPISTHQYHIPIQRSAHEASVSPSYPF